MLKYLCSILCVLHSMSALALPKDFVYLKEIDPTIIQEMRYATPLNFVGRPIEGYQQATCILTKPAALALSHLQQYLIRHHLSLKVFDCYRPQKAVNDFVVWSKDRDAQAMKVLFYPHIDKQDVFKLNYVALKSGHSRGSTVDLTLVSMMNRKEINMGTTFDYLDPTSHPSSLVIGKRAYQARQFLRQAMLKIGFLPLETEWWHFTLQQEPFPQTYFDFPVA